MKELRGLKDLTIHDTGSKPVCSPGAGFRVWGFRFDLVQGFICSCSEVDLGLRVSGVGYRVSIVLERPVFGRQLVLG